MTKAKNPPSPAPDTVEQGSDGLIAMCKGEEVLPVHPSCVDEHKKLGWVEA